MSGVHADGCLVVKAPRDIARKIGIARAEPRWSCPVGTAGRGSQKGVVLSSESDVDVLFPRPRRRRGEQRKVTIHLRSSDRLCTDAEWDELDVALGVTLKRISPKNKAASSNTTAEPTESKPRRHRHSVAPKRLPKRRKRGELSCGDGGYLSASEPLKALCP